MNWKSIDEKLIKRGELLLSLDFLKDYDNELRIMIIIKLVIHLRLQMNILNF
jgi:hypothetical protein